MSIGIIEQINLVSGGHAHYYDTPTIPDIVLGITHLFQSQR